MLNLTSFLLGPLEIMAVKRIHCYFIVISKLTGVEYKKINVFLPVYSVFC